MKNALQWRPVMDEPNEITHKVSSNGCNRGGSKTTRPRPSKPSNWFAKLWGPPSSARIVIIGLAVLLPILGAIPVLLFAPSALFAEYVKWSSPVVTTGLGYLFGHGQRMS
jgi:hypothetical protein